MPDASRSPSRALPGGGSRRRLPVALRRTAALLTQPLVLLTVAHLSMLALRLPLLSMPGWFFRVHLKEAGPTSLVVALAAVPFAGWFIARRLKAHPVLAIGSLVCLGFLFQQGFAWSEGRGLAGMRDRIVTTGHAEFARIAVQQPSMWDVLVNYQTKLQRGELGQFAHSKPPGQLLFYMATERLARRWAHGTEEDARLAALQTTAAVVWPALSYLVLFPLFFLVRRVANEDVALIACLFYLVVPAVTLITLHTDQVIFPCLFVTTVWLAAIAQTKRSWTWAVAAGALLCVSGFFTFALILAGVVALGFAAAVAVQTMPSAQSRARLLAITKTALGMVAGFSLALFALGVAFNYRFLEGLREATAFHEAWKGWSGDLHDIVYFAWIDYLEFAVFLGVPLTVLVLSSLRRSVARSAAGSTESLVWPGLAMLGVFLYLGFFSHTKGETSRLWLPLIPICCGLAANELRARYRSSFGGMVTVVLVLQWLTVWLTKTGQDFR